MPPPPPPRAGVPPCWVRRLPLSCSLDFGRAGSRLGATGGTVLVSQSEIKGMGGYFLGGGETEAQEG